MVNGPPICEMYSISMNRKRKKPPKSPGVDRDRLAIAIQGLKRRDLLTLAQRALSFVPHPDLPELARGLLKPEAIQRCVRGPAGLLTEVKRFHKESLGGKYFESFDVNWKNSTQKSEGTQEFLAECERLLARCAGSARKQPGSEVRDSFELIFDLLRRVDSGEEIVFFADEGGSYEVGVDWRLVLGAYFKCLAASASPAEYAARAVSVIEDFAQHDRARLMAATRRVASKEQKAALQRHLISMKNM